MDFYLKINSEDPVEEIKDDFKGKKTIERDIKNFWMNMKKLIKKTSVLVDPNDKGYLEKRLKEIRVKKTIPN